MLPSTVIPTAPTVPVTAATPPAAPLQDVQLMVDMKSVIPRMLDAIEGAKRVVNVEVFSMLPDGSGLAIGNALAAKARQGVEANLIVDFGGSHELNIASDDPRFVQQVNDLFESDMASATPMTGREPRTVGQRVADVVVGKWRFGY